MITDVCVPLSNLPQLITESKALIAKSGLACPIVAHAGDGNVHVFIMFGDNSSNSSNSTTTTSELSRAKALAASMAMSAISLGGTCTGEHGVGVGKKELLKCELGESTVGLMMSVKRALDPTNLMNPGKVLTMNRK
jgi:D-lactate dehydrogenase (cytochrome)